MHQEVYSLYKAPGIINRVTVSVVNLILWGRLPRKQLQDATRQSRQVRRERLRAVGVQEIPSVIQCGNELAHKKYEIMTTRLQAAARGIGSSNYSNN